VTTEPSDKPAPNGRVETTLKIPAINFQKLEFHIRGTKPYMQARFSAKALTQMADRQQAGSRASAKRDRQARDFDEDYLNAMHLDENGYAGIPAGAFRNAMISACRTVGYAMTRAKLSVFVEADALDHNDGTPLVYIQGKPEAVAMPVRNSTGVADIRVRPMWREWSATLRIEWDADQFSDQDVLNLLTRAGRQVGIGEGRPDSKDSPGIGFGLFEVVNAEGST